MVIQRIQTLWLLIATAIMVFVGLRPFAWVGNIPCAVNDFTILAILNWLTVLLLVIDIFTFKNLRLQKTVALVAIITMVAEVIATYIIMSGNIADCEMEWWGGPVFIVFAALFDLMAYNGMSKDHKKLKNADRLWS